MINFSILKLTERHGENIYIYISNSERPELESQPSEHSVVFLSPTI
jgi:hypothetical protein